MECILCLFFGRRLSLYLLTHFGAERFWTSAMVTGSLTGAELRLTTRSQTYRAPCCTLSKWLYFSLWGNSLFSLMPTVVVGYWSLASLLWAEWERVAWLKMRLGAESKSILVRRWGVSGGMIVCCCIFCQFTMTQMFVRNSLWNAPIWEMHTFSAVCACFAWRKWKKEIRGISV